ELADHPTAYKAHFNLGRLLAGLGDKAGAAAELQAAVTANPEFGVGHLFLAQALLDQGDLAAATREARRGLTLGGAGGFQPLGHYVLADVLERQGRRADAAVELHLGREAEARAKGRSGPAAGGS
ncbi:MAG TPA: tetratricopeptide repeat protein, partial [Thermoanaerobaculia bacterium]